MDKLFGAVLALVLCAFCFPGCVAADPVDDALATLKEITDPVIRDWKFQPSDVVGAEMPVFDDSGWRTASPEFEWGRERVAWLRKAITIPEKVGGVPVAGSKVVLRLGIDDDGECYVNGELRQKFHWGDCNVVLSESAKPGDRYVIAVKGLNSGGPGRLLFANLEFSALGPLKSAAGRIVGDLETGRRLVEAEKDPTKKAEFGRCVSEAAKALDLAALSRADAQSFTASFPEVRRRLEPLSRYLKQYSLHLVGHAHIDMNWLWLWPETVDVCKNTFSTMLKLMDEHPELRFSQSQASTYLAIEEADPALFARIQQRVKSGQWEITGGTWVEGDMNMASGESIVRQILYANRYFKEKFDVEPVICWEPDTFGHAWTIPQILAKSGIKYYYFCRCPKDERVFWWESPDGSRVLAYNMGFYNESVNDRHMDWALELQKRYGVNDAMVVYGVGDHGGGPTRQDIAKALELQKRDVYPNVKFSTTTEYYGRLLAQKDDFPVIRDELNTIFEGCYTSHSDIKKMNRVSENLLPTAEMFSVIAGQYGYVYPQKGFVKAWRNTCFNQFHDIFDGTAIHGSYAYSRGLFNEATGIGNDALRRSLGVIVAQADTRPPSGNDAALPVVVFNPLSWQRTDVVRMDVPETLKGGEIRVIDAKGDEMPSRVIEGKLFFTAKDVPSVGYKVFHLSKAPVFSTVGSLTGIENEFLRVEVDPQSGTVTSIYDKQSHREVLAPGQKGDLLQLLFERPRGMSAWNIGDIEKTLDLDSGASVQVISQAPVGMLRVQHKYNKSRFTQDIMLYPGVPRVDFRLTADWYEQGTRDTSGPMLKVAFPVNVAEGKASFEIPFGSIERPANGREVPAQKWIDVSGNDYGVSLLNDCKYGHDVNGSTMRLTLLRCSDNPDPKPDQGRHEMTYSLYPHSKDWREADTVRRAYELNNPLIPVIADRHSGTLPQRYSFLKVEPSNIVVTALKKAEDSDDWILRFYECEGSDGTATIEFGMPVKSASHTDLIERPMRQPGIPVYGGRIKVPFGKWEIKTLLISD